MEGANRVHVNRCDFLAEEEGILWGTREEECRELRNEQFRGSFCQTQKDKVRKMQPFLRMLRMWPRGDKHAFDSIQTSFLSFLVIFFRSGIVRISR